MEGEVVISLEENIADPFIIGFQEDSLRNLQQAQNVTGGVPLNHIKSQGSIHQKTPRTKNDERYNRGESFAMS